MCRYDYSTESDRLVVRMPTAVHQLFVARIEDAIFSQLKSIREGLGAAASFAQKVYPARSTEVHFPVYDTITGRNSKHEPDASFWHDDAKYPGVVIEVAYSQKKKRLGRLAEDYLLDSDANIRVVVGLDIEYGKKGSRRAAVSTRRTHPVHTADGDELQVVQEATDEVCYLIERLYLRMIPDSVRCFVTSKESLPIIQAYSRTSAISPIKDLCTKRWETLIKN